MQVPETQSEVSWDSVYRSKSKQEPKDPSPFSSQKALVDQADAQTGGQ